MTSYVLTPPAQASVAVVDTAERFPVRRIFCVGRNYAAHVREMGGDPKSEPPVFFTKPADAVVENGARIPFPLATRDLHYEAELVIAIGGSGQDVDPARARDLVWGWAVGLDLTRRDLQGAAKAKGQPWDSGKAFDHSAPIAAITPKRRLDRPEGRIRLTIGGTVRQDAPLSDMIWSPDEIVAAVSKLWRLERGDLIFTGTPEGVGPIQPGETLSAEIDGLTPLTVTVG